MIYFIADAHLGSRLVKDPRKHEMRLVNWLDKVKKDAEAIYMLAICSISGLNIKQLCQKDLPDF